MKLLILRIEQRSDCIFLFVDVTDTDAVYVRIT